MTILRRASLSIFAGAIPAWRAGALSMTFLALLLVAQTFLPPPILEAQAAPDRPTGLTATAGDESVTLRWNNPSDNTITSYQYQVNHNDTSTGRLSGWSQWADIPSSGSSTASHTFTGLNNGSEYRYKIRAVNANGQSKPAPAAAPWYVSAMAAGPPERPTGLAAASGFLSVDLTWDDPSDSSITGYEYQVNHNDTYTGGLSGWSSWSDIPNSDASTTSHTFSGLGKNHEYRYKIRAVNAVGAGKQAPAADPWYVSAVPTGPPPPPPVTQFLADRRCDHYFRLHWKKVSGATGYDLNISKNHRKSWERLLTNKNSNGFKVSKWTKNHTFYFAVRSVNEHDASAWTNLTSAAPPCAVEGLEASYASSGDMSVSWNPAKRAESYSVSFSSDNGKSWQQMVTGLKATTYTFNKDPNAVPYSPDFRVGVQSRKGGLGSPWQFAPIVRVIPPGSRDSDKDFNTLQAAGNESPDGIWSDGTTMWVSDFSNTKGYAYNMATKAHDASKDISFTGNIVPLTMGSDGTTMWIADVVTTSKLLAYSISGKSRDASKDITLHADNTYSSSLWSNGTTMWVADGTDDYIYAYTITTGARDTGKEIDLHSDNDASNGLWSDGVTMWVSDLNDDKLYAYKMSDGSRDSAKDYSDLGSDTDDIYGIWSDGTTMWVVEQDEKKLFAYHSMDPGAKLTTASVGNTTATLYLGAHAGAWWHKRTTPSGDNTCTSVAAGTSTASLSGLAIATAYTYKAYDKANCNDADEIATVTFNTGGASVSNLGEAHNAGTLTIGTFLGASPFTTGSAPGGYTLESVTIKFAAKSGNPGSIAVKIYSDSSGRPGAEISNLTLSGPNNPSNEDAVYTCAGSGCALDAGKTYHVHLSYSGSGFYLWKLTNSGNESRVPSDNGWSIGNVGTKRIGNGNWGFMYPSDVGMFKVTATER